MAADVTRVLPLSLGSLIAVWITFAIVVYVFEPLFLHANFRKLTAGDSKKAFALAQGLHNVALAISAFTIAAGVLGALAR